MKRELFSPHSDKSDNSDRENGSLSLLGNEEDIAIVVLITTIHIRLKFQEDLGQAVYNTISNVCFVMRGQK